MVIDALRMPGFSGEIEPGRSAPLRVPGLSGGMLPRLGPVRVPGFSGGAADGRVEFGPRVEFGGIDSSFSRMPAGIGPPGLTTFTFVKIKQTTRAGRRIARHTSSRGR